MFKIFKIVFSLGLIILLYKFLKKFVYIIYEDDFYEIDDVNLYKKVKDNILTSKNSANYF